MIGLLLTGHGEFANGLLEATEMIVGKQDNYKKVVFKENTNLDTYKNEIKDKIDGLLETTEGVLVLTDLKGGTPFNISVLLSNDYENVNVISGTNLPITIEGSMHSQMLDSPKELAELLVDIGKQGIEVADLSLNDGDTSDDNVEDGI